MLDLHFRVTVDVPQLEGLVPLIDQIGAQSMADFAALTNELAGLRADIEAEASQVLAKLDELAALMQADVLDQQQVEAARQMVADMRPMVQGMVPDAPPQP